MMIDWSVFWKHGLIILGLFLDMACVIFILQDTWRFRILVDEVDDWGDLSEATGDIDVFNSLTTDY